MLKNLIRKNNHDKIHEYHWVDSNKKLKIIQTTLQTSNNKVIKEQKYILPLQFYLNLFLNQKPKIKIAKHSNASFKIRPNMILGTKNHLHKTFLNQFYISFITSILPLIEKKPKITCNFTKNEDYNILISYGWKEILPYNIPHTIPSYILGGAHIQFWMKSPVARLPFLHFSQSQS